jgi:hypothetical protein
LQPNRIGQVTHTSAFIAFFSKKLTGRFNDDFAPVGQTRSFVVSQRVHLSVVRNSKMNATAHTREYVILTKGRRVGRPIFGTLRSSLLSKLAGAVESTRSQLRSRTPVALPSDDFFSPQRQKLGFRYTTAL